MKTKFSIFLLVLSMQMNSYTQSSINDYKYVTVAEKFDFLKSKNQYKLNDLTSFLLKKSGFIVLKTSDKRPQDLYKNNCLGLSANIINTKGFLKTKLHLEFVNCRNEVVFTSETGSSKEKEYKKAYHEALRNAFNSVQALNYKYNGTVPEISSTEKIEIQVPTVAIETTTAPVVAEVPTTEVSTKMVVSKLIVTPTDSGIDFIESSSGTTKYSTHATLFDAVYIIENQAGIIYKRGQNWVREYVENGKTTIEALNIQR
ncbi:MAG: hypothetical protein P8P55_08610 [Flavobacteriaceae bacterium]|jgi:hypothetical protein|nr:hypothetical protein [Flavobacteriaceae bacterium]